MAEIKSTGCRLLCKFDSAGFADDVDFDDARVFEGGFDFGSNVAGHFDGLEVVDAVGLDDNAQFVSPRAPGRPAERASTTRTTRASGVVASTSSWWALMAWTMVSSMPYLAARSAPI